MPFRRYHAKMSDPAALFKEERDRTGPLRGLQHGDMWHNNLLFHKARSGVKASICDWQVRHDKSHYLFWPASNIVFVSDLPVRQHRDRRLLLDLLLHDGHLPQAAPRHDRLAAVSRRYRRVRPGLP